MFFFFPPFLKVPLILQTNAFCASEDIIMIKIWTLSTIVRIIAGIAIALLVRSVSAFSRSVRTGKRR